MCSQQKLQRGVHASNSMVVIGAREPVSNPVSGGYSIYDCTDTHFYHSPVYGSIRREYLWSNSLLLVVVPRFSLYRRHKAACSCTLHGTNSTIILIANALCARSSCYIFVVFDVVIINLHTSCHYFEGM